MYIILLETEKYRQKKKWMEITKSNETNKETKEDVEPNDFFFFFKRKSLQTRQRKSRESQNTLVGFIFFALNPLDVKMFLSKMLMNIWTLTQFNKRNSFYPSFGYIRSFLFNHIFSATVFRSTYQCDTLVFPSFHRFHYRTLFVCVWIFVARFEKCCLNGMLTLVRSSLKLHYGIA